MDMTAYVSREDYRSWAQTQPRGRFERIDGRVVRMPAEQLVHVRLKYAVWRALDDVILATGLAAQAFGDGVTVEAGPHSDYEPDAVVNLGPEPPLGGLTAPNPVIVVEVLSPGTQAYDQAGKLAGYFRVASILHYLVVSNARREVVHHRREAAGIVSTSVTSGDIVLDPPGITFSLDQIYLRTGL